MRVNVDDLRAREYDRAQDNCLTLEQLSNISHDPVIQAFANAGFIPRLAAKEKERVNMSDIQAAVTAAIQSLVTEIQALKAAIEAMPKGGGGKGGGRKAKAPSEAELTDIKDGLFRVAKVYEDEYNGQKKYNIQLEGGVKIGAWERDFQQLANGNAKKCEGKTVRFRYGKNAKGYFDVLAVGGEPLPVAGGSEPGDDDDLPF